MGIKSIKDLDLKSKRVLIRVDFNVPLDENGNITDDVPHKGSSAHHTVRHRPGSQGDPHVPPGRPKGKVIRTRVSFPVARSLSELLGTSVNMAPDCIGDKVKKMVGEPQTGRGSPAGKPAFPHRRGKGRSRICQAARIAGRCLYRRCLCHGPPCRMHPLSGICRLHQGKGRGFPHPDGSGVHQQGAARTPSGPLPLIGGAKVSDKLELLENLIDKVDKIDHRRRHGLYLREGPGPGYRKIPGGGRSPGYGPRHHGKGKAKGVKFYLPVDCVCAADPKGGSAAS